MRRTLFYTIGSKLDPESLEVGDLFYSSGNVCIVLHGSFGLIYKILGCSGIYSILRLKEQDVYSVSMLQDCVEIAGLKFPEVYDEVHIDGHLG